MTPERWKQIAEIFQTVVERPAAERASFLTKICGPDQELRREVESLLAHESEDSFIQNPIGHAAQALTQAPADDMADDMIGRRLGAYRVTRLIGHGGMGAVYEALRDDAQFEQRVAVKVIRRGMETAFARERFLRERQILASLEHPHIARLLDGGATADGLPYFVMEFVAGEPITSYCQRRQLALNDRLRLFRSVCAAVQHAHQKLVVHRDLKPSNILVTEDGAPKLLDFGIAKLLTHDAAPGSATRTETALRLLTPDYASPEQALGQTITTAADVYSLGVVLYELITERRLRQFKTLAPAEIERAICETSPPKPSDAVSRETFSAGKWQKHLAGDLDNIVLMAMRKEPERRYQSVEQFSEDLRRYLDGLPVNARADTFKYRAGKFVRRHKLGVIAATLVALSLLGGMVATTRAARIARAERARAERRFEQVRKLSNTFLFDFHDKIQNLAGSTEAREMVVKTALEYLDSLAQEAAGDSALQLELAKAYEKVADVQGNPFAPNLGKREAALASYQKALAIYEPLAPYDPGDGKLLHALSNIYFRIGDLQLQLGRSAQAEESFSHGQRVIEQMLSARMAVSSSLIISGHQRVANARLLEGDTQAALSGYRQGLAIAERDAAEKPEPSAQHILAVCHERLATALLRTGDLEGALGGHRQALRILEALVERQPGNRSYRRAMISSHLSIGNVLGNQANLNLGDAVGARDHYRQALAFATGLAADDPRDVQAQRDLSRATELVAKTLRDSDPARAAGLYRKALAISETLLQLSPDNIDARRDQALGYVGLAHALRQLGQAPEALAMLRQALAAQQAIAALDPARTTFHREMRFTYGETGAALQARHDETGALANYHQALAVTEKLLADHPSDLYLQFDRADCYETLGRFYSTLALRPTLPRARQNAARRESCEWYRRSLQTWDAWLAQGVATAYATRRRKEAARALSSCDAALAQPSATPER
jgi:tetratricopeptide (TPR) repeat protein/tRNA A-37 threonylcarbamoyl transferase component Bud32